MRGVIQLQRIRRLNGDGHVPGAYVLYWMQQSHRVACNHALEYAVEEANRRRLGVLVGFGLTDAYPEANARHYAFLLQGLRDVAAALEARGIRLVVRRGAPDDVALALAQDAALVVCDRGYLHHQQAWRRRVAERAGRAVIQVESDVVVPIEAASAKAEVAARTLRTKIHRAWDEYLVPLEEVPLAIDASSLDVEGDIDPHAPAATLATLDVDRDVAPVRRFEGGADAARRRLDKFIRTTLAGYAERRSEPGDWHSSLLSSYLHFGQISPLEIALAARRAPRTRAEDRGALLEELVVRRELSANFVHFTRRYDTYGGLPKWARASLAAHRTDARPVVYRRTTLEQARTHDPYWNAAMREMRHTGFMHNYMRMYWGKKILEWSRTPEAAFKTALYLNNRYFLDGRDPNSFAGVGWCFGLHDRPWTERPIFGMVRYMNDKGLRRKFDMDRYVEGVDALVRAEAGAQPSDPAMAAARPRAPARRRRRRRTGR
jgi:deoxyribodipyrimidine photo-lyase